ncbi:MAG TPA: sialidase family protein [Solirubrobacteraceae bacterium]|nr:sialidase family protein [Solirubrobacteraceae bacterium]
MLTSTDGGTSFTQHQVTPATNNPHSRNGFGRSGCTVRTDSRGVVYVFDFQFGFSPTTAAPGQIQMIRSFDGGAHWERPVNIFTAFDTCNAFEASIGRCVEDGVGGARSDLSPAPSVDIANGAPTGGDASNRLVISWVDGRDGLNNEHVLFSTSTNGGASWTAPTAVERSGDRGYYSAPAIAPNGTDVWLVYNAFTEPFKTSAVGPTNGRPLIGQVLHATAGAAGVGSFTPAHRGAPGDARASSQNNLAAEFLGDYVYAAATRRYGVSVWNDVRNGADCPAIDEYRQALHEEALATGQPTAEAEEPRGEGDQGGDEPAPVAPAPQQQCPANFGNSDIFGWSSLSAP